MIVPTTRRAPDNLRSRKSHANASQWRRLALSSSSGAITNTSRASDRWPPEPTEATLGFHQAERQLTTFPVLRYCSGQKKRWLNFPYQHPSGCRRKKSLILLSRGKLPTRCVDERCSFRGEDL